MAKHNPSNERVKREYFRFLAEAKGRDEATIDRVAKSLARFEAGTGHKDFRRFHREQAIAFKRKMSEALNARSGEKLSKATILSTLRDLIAFFEWLAREPGFRSHILVTLREFGHTQLRRRSSRAKSFAQRPWNR